MFRDPPNVLFTVTRVQDEEVSAVATIDPIQRITRSCVPSQWYSQSWF